MGKPKYFLYSIPVMGYIPVEVKAEDDKMAKAMVKAAIDEQDGKKYGLTKKQFAAISQMKNVSFDNWLIPKPFKSRVKIRS